MVAIKEQIERGDYRIDATAVADAILRRMHRLDVAGGPAAQNECSYPESGSLESA